MTNDSKSCFQNGPTPTILLVEDDAGDQELTRRAFQSDSIKIDLRIVGDGVQAMDYLLRRGEFEHAKTSPKPDLILLDLNMPKKNGREVLQELQAEQRLSRIPVVVLTTSGQQADILGSYDLGCSSYIQKPVGVDEFTEAIRGLCKFWFGIVTLPPPDSNDSGVKRSLVGQS